MQTARPAPRRTVTRGKGGLPDENATAKHSRPLSNTNINPALGPSRIPVKDAATASLKARPALGEVTLTNINLRKQPGSSKDDGPKRIRAGSTTSKSLTKSSVVPSSKPTLLRNQPQRAPLGHHTQRAPQYPVLLEEDEDKAEQFYSDNRMDVAGDDEPIVNVAPSMPPSLMSDPVLARYQIHEEDEYMAVEELPAPARPKERPVWPNIGTERQARAERQLQQVRDVYDGTEVIDPYETTMVSEYSEEIFDYMRQLESSVMPSPNYIDAQVDFDWDTRQKLIDWLGQVHLRYHLMPETLWIAVNIVDRFLSKRAVTIVKLQLVGITALFIAAKYEEILAPSVEEFVYLSDRAYTKEEIFKGERIILETIDFNVSQYCSPYTWMRRISKADDYDLYTRTLGKFLSEVTLLDHRFLRASPHLVAAVAMYSARIMLGSDWDAAFIYHSDYTEEQLLPGHNMLVQKLAEDDFSRLFVFKKYANKRFLKASIYALTWAKANASGEGAVQAMAAS